MAKDNWFSNFARSPIFMADIDATYPTVEHAFQAAKSLDIKERIRISKLRSPGAAKKAGRKVELRPDWEEIKLGVMYVCLCAKFSDEYWYKELKLTGEENIVEEDPDIEPEKKLELSNYRLIFSAFCPQCGYMFQRDCTSLVHRDCPECGWKDDSA